MACNWNMNQPKTNPTTYSQANSVGYAVDHRARDPSQCGADEPVLEGLIDVGVGGVLVHEDPESRYQAEPMSGYDECGAGYEGK